MATRTIVVPGRVRHERRQSSVPACRQAGRPSQAQRLDEGGYDAVRRYAKIWSREHSSQSATAYVPLSFAPGEAYQFDWSHEIVVMSGVTTTLKVAHVRLCHNELHLQLAELAAFAFEPVGPHMCAGLGRDELGVEGDVLAEATHAAFEHVAHAELTADLFGVDRLALVGEGGVAGDDEAVGEMREVGGEVVGDAVGEIVLFLVGAARLRLVLGDRGAEQARREPRMPDVSARRARLSARDAGDGVRRPRAGVRLFQGRLPACLIDHSALFAGIGALSRLFDHAR